MVAIHVAIALRLKTGLGKDRKLRRKGKRTMQTISSSYIAEKVAIVFIEILLRRLRSCLQ